MIKTRIDGPVRLLRHDLSQLGCTGLLRQTHVVSRSGAICIIGVISFVFGVVLKEQSINHDHLLRSWCSLVSLSGDASPGHPNRNSEPGCT